MLAISRKDYERVRFKLPDGRYAWLSVVEIVRGKVRLGLDFPTDVVILREELLPEQEHYAATTRNHGRPQGRDDRQEETKAADPEFGFSLDGLDPA
jgi:sRNA-binding carbon storage regulator CsrA